MVILFAQLNRIFYLRFFILPALALLWRGAAVSSAQADWHFLLSRCLENYTGMKHIPATYNLADYGGGGIMCRLLR
jgi:hypothetical protein